MKKFFAVPLACVLLSTGCASTAQLRHVEGKETANQKTLRETDQRLNALEQSVATLDSQVAQLKNRTFEVRTRGGQKTGMTVVPILPPAPAKPAPSAAAGASSDSPGAAGAAPAPEPAGQRPPDVALGHNGPSAVTAPAMTAPAVAAQTASPVAVLPVAASAGSSGAAPLAAEPASSSAKTSEKTPAAKGKETPLAAVAPETASGPKGRIIDPAAPPRSFPQDSPSALATANGAAATKPAVASPAAANPSQGKAATAGPHGQVGTSNNTSQPANGAGTPSVGLPPVAAPEPVVPPAVSPTNFANQGTNPPAVSASPGSAASSDKGAPAGGHAAVPVPSLPPSELALPPEYPGLPPVEAAGSATPTATSAPTVRAADPAAQTAPAAPAKPSPSAAATQQAATQQAARPAKNEKAAYDAALKFMTSGRSAEGITRFEGFLQEYPQGVYAANAEYWIGEGLYAQGNYQQALNQFRKVDASYPQHHKNADALLKTGMCLSRLGDKTAAAEAYKQLLARFPNSEAARIARSRGLAR